MNVIGGSRLARDVPVRMAIVVVIGAILATTFAGSDTVAQSVTRAEIDHAAEARSRYGFRSDRSHVRSLASRRLDPASEEYGFPITPAEARGLLQRSAFVQELEAGPLSYVRGLSGYAGEWIDQEDGGRLVVGLTDAPAAVKGKVRARMPAASRGVRFEVVNDSARDLDVALRRAASAWDALGSGIDPQAVAIHYRHNRITVKVRRGQLAAARSFKARLEARLGVDVGFATSRPVRDLAPASACSGRKRCYGPFRLGVRVNFPRAFPDSKMKTYCAMAFHIRDPRAGNKDRTFMTAGHCTYGRRGPWQHHDDFKARYGKVGTRVSTKYTTKKRDIALVKIEDWRSNASTRIYGDSGWKDGARLTAEGRVVEGEILCVSLAQKDRVWCGTADATHQWWTSTTADPDIRVWGAALDFPGNPGRASIPGDSGSPIYRTWKTSTKPVKPRRTPIGIANAGSVDTPNQQEGHTIYFASVWWALNNDDGWPGLEILTAPPPPLTKRPFTATWVGSGGKDHRTKLVARPVEGATSYRWDLGDGSRPKSGRKLTHRFRNAGEYRVRLTVRYRGGYQRSRTMRITANPVKAYAPFVYIHPKERSWPMAAESFIGHSRLLFAHDEGCDPTSVESGKVSGTKLGSGGYQAKVADDDDCSLAAPSFSSDQYTRPGDPGNVLPTGERREGFYLDLDDARRPGAGIKGDPVYYEFKRGRYVIYWFFYGYQGRAGRHEGDWEHIAVRLDDVGLGKRFAYYRHECAPRIWDRSRMKKGFGQSGTGFFAGTHPIVYSAVGSHASYWKRNGSWDISAGCGLPPSTVADRTKKGVAWQTWKSLKDAHRGWYGYGGAWGPPGAVVEGRRINDGPLGPSRHALSEAVPGW